MKNIQITNTEVLSDNWYFLRRYTYRFQQNGEWVEQQREAYDRGNGAVILLYNRQQKTVILTRQFRLPTYVNGNASGMLIEACAGLLDKDNPEVAIRRETEEETGYKVGTVEKVFEAYMSPGSVTEILYFFIAAIAVFVAAADAQPLSSSPLSSVAIDSLVLRTLRAFEVPGIAVCVVKDGKVVHSRGYGVRSLATRQPVDEHTLFGIASNSKAFTTAALGMLVDEGKLQWDDKVRKYIPEFRLHDPYVTEEFTVRDLLCHRSGLGLGAGDLMFFPDSSDFTIADILGNLKFLKPVTSFRSAYAYDNNLYIVAGEVVARVSGMSWEEFVERRIMGPLGMTHSAASWDRLRDTTDWIDAHARVEGVVRVIARSRSKVDHAAGGIYSSIADLSKWVLLHLSDGKYGPAGTALFSPAVLRERWAAQTILPVGGPGPYNTHFAAYGLGFGLSDVKGYKQVSHTGGLEGMVTQITMIPELKLGIIVLTNQEEGLAFNAITNQIKDGYLGVTGTDRVTEYTAFRKRQLVEEKRVLDSIGGEVAAAQKRALAVDAAVYVGTYRDAWFGDVVITSMGGKLHFDSKRSPKLTGELMPYKGNTFIARWKDRSMNADAYVIFELDEKGVGSGIRMKPVSPLTDFSYDFQDLELKRK